MKLFVRILLGIAGLLLLLVIAAAAVVATMDKRALVAPLEARLEKATGREVTIGGEPRIDLSLTPSLVLEDVSFANAPWGSAKEMLRAKRIEVRIALLPLLSRRIDLERFTLVEPKVLLETDRKGTPNWTFGAPGAQAPPPAAGAAQAAAGAFALGEVIVERGDVTYRNGRTGEVTPVRIERLYLRGREAGAPLVAEFRGSVDDVPVHLEGAFGPLAVLQSGPWPWPISVEGDIGGRPTKLEAKLHRTPDTYEAREFAMTLGASRVAGTWAWQARAGGRPLLRFDLEAQTLQALDLALAAAAGARPAKGTKATDARLFPATPVSFDGLRAADAQGRLAIGTLVLRDGRKLGPLRAKATLQDGRLVVDDFALTGYGGKTSGRIVVDVREVPALGLRFDGRGLDLAALLAAAGVPRQVQGAKTDLALTLDMRGDSPRAWASSVDGTVQLKVGAGSLPSGNEGLSTELRQVLDALIPSRASGRTELACAVVRLPFRDGVARVDRSIAFETDQLGASASGSIDLRGETLDLAFAPRLRSGVPVDLARLAGAVRMRGPLANPRVEIDPAGIVGAAAEMRGLLKGDVTGLLGGTRGGGSGNECAVAAGTAVATPAERPAPPPERAGSGTPQDVEKALRKLFGR